MAEKSMDFIEEKLALRRCLAPHLEEWGGKILYLP